jgi:integrase
LSVKIEKEVLKNGAVRWRARGVSTGKDPVTGRRTQRTITGRTQKEVEAEVARITGKVADRIYVRPRDDTVAEVIDAYLASRAITKREANTRLSYAKALLPVRERLGHRKARSVTRQDVENLLTWMETSGRRRGGAAGTGLGPRSVQLTLGRLSAAFELACRDGKLAANPCRYVDQPGQEHREVTTWSEGELRKFLAAVADDRLAACWLLSAMGLRRGEVLGLKWSDFSVSDGTLTIARSRVLVDGTVIEKSPKSRRSWRVLPLFEPVTGALEALRVRQLDEMAAAGPAYANSGYVVADELGQPVHPEWYSDEFRRIYLRAGLPKIRLHDTRATMNTILEQASVSDSLRAAWLGHKVEVNRESYVAKPRPEELAPVRDTIGDIFKAV